MPNRILLLLVLLFQALASYGITDYKAGDKLYVLSTVGLALRETPDPAGAKLQTLPNGAPLIVQKEDLKKTAHTVSEFKGFVLKGYWVKVKTWDNKTGYVFDAYLSKYQAPAKVILKDHVDAKYSIAEQYMMVHSKPKGKRANLPKTATRKQHYRQVFVNGATVEVDQGEGGSSYTIVFAPATSIEEAYLIGKALWLEGKAAKSTYIDGLLLMMNEDETKQVTVEIKNKSVVLQMMIAD